MGSNEMEYHEMVAKFDFFFFPNKLAIYHRIFLCKNGKIDI